MQTGYDNGALADTDKAQPTRFGGSNTNGQTTITFSRSIAAQSSKDDLPLDSKQLMLSLYFSLFVWMTPHWSPYLMGGIFERWAVNQNGRPCLEGKEGTRQYFEFLSVRKCRPASTVPNNNILCHVIQISVLAHYELCPETSWRERCRE